ncbi:site-specific DNA-methyltransferase [Pontiella agarivorans]|uniref:site-specific DNA-methyltransferase (adenine-specific) n=1 Tax=Pontiella agarivorans TaxID=3038953 RepID=A0ABU5MVH8_9BACT|nr:site-specific DNA-methyltransferase [Pontiella agarivorans]MDZ8118096.1 site-specific DNA-methyltransferase [Pontiella agarivorans]
MPTLDWIGKDAVIRHHKEVEFRLLEPDAALSHGDESDGNLIVQGDNLHALKALLPKYAGRVKCIYIDPPYNTGNEGWIYNDKVNSPEINRWLGQTVGKEAEDLSRHDKWLCMMYPRLVLLKQFLSDDGAIFVSIDDNEVASLRLLMDEIFGKKNFVETIIWQKNYAPKASAKHFSEAHDYIVVYKGIGNWGRNLIPRSEKQNKNYKNYDNDPRGLWRPNNLAARNYYSKGTYSIKCPSGRVIDGPPSGSYWRVSEEKFWELDRDGRIWWGKDGNNVPAPKIFLNEVQDGVVPMSLWFYDDVGHTQEAKRDLLEVLSFAGSDDVFITPKPTRLIQRILQIASDKDSIILDSFAGSGTTGHAVLKQNAADGGNRKFILVEMEEQIAANITAERVRRVAAGYTDAKGNDVPGLGSGFQFCRLSDEPLFNEFGDIRDDVTFTQLADFVWFSETGRGRDGAGGPPAVRQDAGKIEESPRLGIHENRAIYLLFNGILGDRRPQGGNILTKAVLDSLPPYDGPKTIYAAATRLGPAALQRENIVFKQTPYAIEV